MLAIFSILPGDVGLAGSAALAGAGSTFSPHDISAGNMSVEIWEGGPFATEIASTASLHNAPVEDVVRTQVDIFLATVSISYCNCASNFVW